MSLPNPLPPLLSPGGNPPLSCHACKRSAEQRKQITRRALLKSIAPPPLTARAPHAHAPLALFCFLFLFLKGYGARPTTNTLVGLVFALSECSPTGAPTPAPGRSRMPALGGVGGGVAGKGGGSGLTAGTDALRLACLKCLEVRLYHDRHRGHWCCTTVSRTLYPSPDPATLTLSRSWAGRSAVVGRLT